MPDETKFDCKTCYDKGFVKVKRGKRWEVVPCPKCNEDGMEEITG